jgi:hypothetical protein
MLEGSPRVLPGGRANPFVAQLVEEGSSVGAVHQVPGIDPGFCLGGKVSVQAADCHPDGVRGVLHEADAVRVNAVGPPEDGIEDEVGSPQAQFDCLPGQVSQQELLL